MLYKLTTCWSLNSSSGAFTFRQELKIAGKSKKLFPNIIFFPFFLNCSGTNQAATTLQNFLSCFLHCKNSSLYNLTLAVLENAGKTISCALIGHISNDVSDLVGAKATKGKECCSNVSSRLWGGALRDDTKNGCEED